MRAGDARRQPFLFCQPRDAQNGGGVRNGIQHRRVLPRMLDCTLYCDNKFSASVGAAKSRTSGRSSAKGRVGPNTCAINSIFCGENTVCKTYSGLVTSVVSISSGVLPSQPYVSK